MMEGDLVDFQNVNDNSGVQHLSNPNEKIQGMDNCGMLDGVAVVPIENECPKQEPGSLDPEISNDETDISSSKQIRSHFATDLTKDQQVEIRDSSVLKGEVGDHVLSPNSCSEADEVKHLPENSCSEADEVKHLPENSCSEADEVKHLPENSCSEQGLTSVCVHIQSTVTDNFGRWKETSETPTRQETLISESESSKIEILNYEVNKSNSNETYSIPAANIIKKQEEITIKNQDNIEKTEKILKDNYFIQSSNNSENFVNFQKIIDSSETTSEFTVSKVNLFDINLFVNTSSNVNDTEGSSEYGRSFLHRSEVPSDTETSPFSEAEDLKVVNFYQRAKQVTQFSDSSTPDEAESGTEWMEVEEPRDDIATEDMATNDISEMRFSGLNLTSVETECIPIHEDNTTEKSCNSSSPIKAVPPEYENVKIIQDYHRGSDNILTKFKYHWDSNGNVCINNRIPFVILHRLRNENVYLESGIKSLRNTAENNLPSEETLGDIEIVDTDDNLEFLPETVKTSKTPLRCYRKGRSVKGNVRNAPKSNAKGKRTKNINPTKSTLTLKLRKRKLEMVRKDRKKFDKPFARLNLRRVDEGSCVRKAARKAAYNIRRDFLFYYI